MLFCVGVLSPAAPAEGNYDAGDVISFPEELMNSILLLLQFPRDLQQGRILHALQRVCFLVTEQSISSCSSSSWTESSVL